MPLFELTVDKGRLFDPVAEKNTDWRKEADQALAQMLLNCTQIIVDNFPPRDAGKDPIEDDITANHYPANVVIGEPVQLKVSWGDGDKLPRERINEIADLTLAQLLDDLMKMGMLPGTLASAWLQQVATGDASFRIGNIEDCISSQAPEDTPA